MTDEVAKLFTAFQSVYAASKPRDLKAFAKALASFNTLYRRASEADQGSYHAAVAEWMAGTPEPAQPAESPEARAIAFLATWYEWQGDPQPWWDALPPDRKAVAIRAALATQPATGRAMGGEAPSEDWLTEVLDDSLDMDWTGRVGAQTIIREWDRRYVD